jgi:hypothetical protein
MKRGKKLLVQVKSGSSSFSRAQKLRLRQEAKRKGAKALLIRYRRGRFYSKIIY